MNKTFFQHAVSLSLSAFFTVTMLAGIGVLADTSAPATQMAPMAQMAQVAQMAGHGTPAPRA